MRYLATSVVLVAICGCGEKKEPVTTGEGMKIRQSIIQEASKVPEAKVLLADFIKNKRVFVLMEKDGRDEEVFAQFYGNGTYQNGVLSEGEAVTTDAPDMKGTYEVDGLAITFTSEEGKEILLDSPAPELSRGDKLTLTQEDGSQEILLVTRVEEAGIVKVVNSSFGKAPETDDPGAEPFLGEATSTDAAIGFIAGGDVASFRAYLENGGDVNGQDKDGNTLLAVAAAYGRSEIAKTLIAREAALDRKNKDGSTPLHSAAFLGQVGIVKLLIDAGADASIRNNTNSTAPESAELAWAEAKGWVELLNAIMYLPLGQALDMDEVKAGRAAAAELLRNVGD